ncbi:MAG: hypothetical protein ACOC8C_02685 [Chloroflexota bacterium]
MTERTLHERLVRLREEHETRLREIQQEQEHCASAQTEVQREIQRLQRELRGLKETYQELDAESEIEGQRHVRRETDLVLEGLEASYTTILETRDHWLKKVELRRQRQDLLREDPELRQTVKDYKDFERGQSDTLESLPPSYRKAVIEEHERTTARIAPYLQLVEEERSLTCHAQVVFQLVMARELDNDLIGWVFPFRDDRELSPDAYNALLEVVWALQHKVTSLGVEPDWFLDDASLDTWAGFDTLLIEGDYSGEGSPLDSACHFLSDVASLELFDGADVRVLVAEMSKEAWHLGKRRPKPKVTAPETEAATAREEEPRLVEVTGGWYTADDIVSWERPLRVVSDSLWNVQARRLRTLLIRMVARGKVGEERVGLRRLWEDLPSPHKENLETGVARLLEEGLIVESELELNDGHNVTMSPERLEDVQDLINRDITQFWAGIIASEVEAE